MRKQKGFTLIELLIVVAIIGIIAAIAIPNLLNAINRGRQKRTMADMRSIATAVESYQVDFNFYPKVGPGNIDALNTFLQPTYIKRLPANDGWNQAFQWDGSASVGTGYTIWSKAKGGGGAETDGPGVTTDFGKAIVFSDGQFVTWPEGQQTN
jgi:type II secretion system protein G